MNPTSRKPRLFGPGTRLSLLALAGLVVYGWATQPKAPSIVKPEPGPKPPPLWKPEPAVLLRLRLTPDQVAAVRKEEAAWQRRKAELNQAIHDAAPNLKQADLAAVSELSRTYDATRERYWRAVVRVLTPDQRPALEALRP